MRQTEPVSHQTRRRLLALAVFAVLLSVAFVYPRTASIATGGAAAQQQRRRRTTSTGARRQPQTVRRRGINYSRFLHDNNHVKYDRAKRANCTSCHTLASPLQYDIKDYPNHPACVNCHRQQFFTGARPPICTVVLESKNLARRQERARK